MPFPGTSFLNSASFLSVGALTVVSVGWRTQMGSRRGDPTRSIPVQRERRHRNRPGQQISPPVAAGPSFRATGDDARPRRWSDRYKAASIGTARQHARQLAFTGLPTSAARSPLRSDATACSLQTGQSRRSIQADPGRQPPRSHGPRVEPLGAPGRQAPLLLDRSSCGEPRRRPLHRRLRLQHSVCNACDTLSISKHRLLPASRSPGGHG